MSDMMRVKFELTDTFGGDANYSWVRRHSINVPRTISDLALVRRAKAWCGMNGVRARVECWNGDTIAIYPHGECVVLFITCDY